MGQQLFGPPNVKGWPGGRSWLNTATVLARHNFAQTVASGQLRISEYEQRLASASSALEARLIEEEERARQEAQKAGKGNEPVLPPNPSTDPAELIHNERLTNPDKILDLLIDLLLQGGIEPGQRTKLLALLSDGKPTGATLDGRVRETVHAILSMPEYQLA